MSPLYLIWFGSDQIQIIARTPVSAYIPGQTILLEINVNNQSNEEISKFTVELMKVSFLWLVTENVYLDFYYVLFYFQLINYSNQERHCECRYGHTKLKRETLHKLTGEGCGSNQDKIIRIAVEILSTTS